METTRLGASNPTDDELNEVLARVAGVKIAEFRPGEWYCAANPADIASGSVRWNPLHDANQMERVKERLRENNRTYKCVWDITLKVHLVWISEKGFPVYERDVIKGIHESELRAFALAAYAMDQSQKGTT